MFLKSLILLLLISPMSKAADYSIFEVKKSLPMENNEVAYKDYYINAGEESGIKKGMYLNVVRSSTIIDPTKNITQGSLKIPIAKLQIIQVDKHLSVGRLATQTANDERPSVEFEAIMIGDILDMESASMEAPIVKTKRKTASVDEEMIVPQALAAKVPAAVLAPVAVQAPASIKATVTPTQQAGALPAKAQSAPEMVRVAVPPPAPQSNRNDAKKAENIL